MNLFLWTAIAWCLLNAVAAVIALSNGYVVKRTNLILLLDVITSVGVALWAVALLAGAI